jgi:hypothetical protein
MKTAIDFLLSRIPDLGKDIIGRDVIKEAKKQEKQMIIEAVNETYYSTIKSGFGITPTPIDGEDYYRYKYE